MTRFSVLAPKGLRHKQKRQRINRHYNNHKKQSKLSIHQLKTQLRNTSKDLLKHQEELKSYTTIAHELKDENDHFYAMCRQQKRELVQQSMKLKNYKQQIFLLKNQLSNITNNQECQLHQIETLISKASENSF